jgi:hypothetical protein
MRSHEMQIVKFGFVSFNGPGGAPFNMTVRHGLGRKPKFWMANADYQKASVGFGITTQAPPDSWNLFFTLWNNDTNGFTSGVTYSFRWIALA